MVGTKGISEAIIEVNDEIISNKSNSVEVKHGFGEVSIDSQSVGGGGSEIITTRDGETRVAVVKITVRTTAISSKLLASWDQNFGSNVVRVSDQESDFSFVMTNASVANDPAMSMGSDGNIEVEFKGSPENT